MSKKKIDIYAFGVEVISRATQTIVAAKIFDFFPLTIFRKLALKPFIQIGNKSNILHGFQFLKPHPARGGYLKIGKKVSIHKNCEIDYSGGVTIEDDVWISQNVLIETHTHLISKERKNDWKLQRSSLFIGEDAWVGANAVIMPSCNRIGKFAIIGAGAVVTKDVADWAIVGGIPAKEISSRNNNIKILHLKLSILLFV